MARLIYTDAAGKRHEVEISASEMSIGRTAGNTIRLRGDFVSRSHARIIRASDGSVRVRDLGSHNGTYVNSLRVTEQQLRHGDEVRIGENVLRYVDEDAGQRPRPTGAEQAQGEGSRTVVVGALPLEDGRLMRTVCEAARQPLSELVRTEEVSGRTAEMGRSLLLLCRVAEKLNQARSLDELLETVVDVSIQATGAERGFLFLLGQTECPQKDDEAAVPLVPVVERDPLRRESKGERVNISTTIARKVVREKVALITKDTGQDPELVSSESIALLKIRSAVCVPLWSGEQVIGILYLDSTRSVNPFSDMHLDLLTAVGYQAATGIERAKLAERMRQEEIMRRSLMRFHSPDVVEMILGSERSRGAESLSPRELFATVLFCDICGFTRIAEKMTPIETARMLSSYFALMTEVIFQHRGTLDKYIGDGIMAVFGAPFSYGDDASRADSAALGMISAARQLRFGEEELQIRIGINTGRVVAGSIGTERHMDYTVLGDAVNLAARLESECAPGSILVSASTRDLVCDRFECAFAGERSVKGREQPVGTWWVKGPKDKPAAGGAADESDGGGAQCSN